jgi:hypothetical protein
MRIASWILIGAIGLSTAACQTQSASMGTPGPASREACAEKARQEVPDSSSQRNADRQRDRYYVYRACMHVAGLKP